MRRDGPVSRVVVVHGPAEPILTATLCLVGLCPVFKTDEVTVWAPDDWRHLPDDGARGPCGWPPMVPPVPLAALDSNLSFEAGFPWCGIVPIDLDEERDE